VSEVVYDLLGEDQFGFGGPDGGHGERDGGVDCGGWRGDKGEIKDEGRANGGFYVVNTIWEGFHVFLDLM